MIRYMRVGIPIVGGKSWFGGVTVVNLLMKALSLLPRHEKPIVYLVVNDYSLKEYDCHQPFVNLFDGIIFMGKQRDLAEKIIGSDFIYCHSDDTLFKLIDFFYPVSMGVLPGRCSAAWIHDFQHRYFPGFFSPEQIAQRDRLFQHIAQYAKLIFVLSEAIKKDFEKFYPESRAVVVPLLHRVCPDDNLYKGDPVAIQNKYNLPERFILCSNQFWIHKNHQRLFEAIAYLHKNKQDVHLVCTGNTGDFRTKDYFPGLQHLLAKEGINHLVHILGLIPRDDQMQLLRRSMFVVQPSLFEGQGLIVQECNTLGKTILLSDLDVHKEQNFEYAVYFQKDNITDLAEKIYMLTQRENVGPNIDRENSARKKAYMLTIDYARKFCSLVYQSQIIFSCR